MKAVALTTTLPATDFEAFDNLIAIAPDFTSFALPDLMQSHSLAQQKAPHDA